MLDWEF